MLLKTNIADANKRLFKEPESGAAPEKLKFSGADYRPATPKSGIHQLPSEQTLNAIQSSGDDLGSIEISLAVKKRCSFCLSILIRSVVILASFYFSAVFSNIPFEQPLSLFAETSANFDRYDKSITSNRVIGAFNRNFGKKDKRFHKSTTTRKEALLSPAQLSNVRFWLALETLPGLREYITAHNKCIQAFEESCIEDSTGIQDIIDDSFSNDEKEIKVLGTQFLTDIYAVNQASCPGLLRGPAFTSINYQDQILKPG